VSAESNIEYIIEGCKNQKRESQKDLYDLYCDAMFTVAYRIVNNNDDAHDVLQETFIEVFKHIKSFRNESSVGAWIKTILVRKALKKLKELKFVDNFVENGVEIPSDFLDDLSGEYLEQLILSLPEGFRTVFLLFEVEGYSHQEIADMLSISESTSKSQLSRAKKSLRMKIEKINQL
jgi:RNA polymerase sigma factor (sigma-70 family)